MRRKRLLSLFMLSMGVALLVAAMSVGMATASSHNRTAAKAGGNLIVTQVGAFDTLDPQLSYVSNDWGLLYNTELTLLNFPTKAGKAGTQLVPQAATSMPKISGDGKTYVFTIRSGLKFDNGQKVTAANFYRSFQRNISPKMYAPYGIYDGLNHFIKGAAGFAKGKTENISGIKANGLKLTIHLTRVVPQFSSIMAMPWFMAIPKNMPYYSKNGSGILKYPSAGPYYIASNNLTQLTVLKRNKYFPASLKKLWPANPAQIIVKSYPNSSGDPQLLQAEAGQVDLAGVPSQDAAKVKATYGVNKGQFHVGPTTCITWNALNNKAKNGTTDTLAMRRAFNYLVSRKALIAFSGPLSGQASDQILVPAIPGYHKFNVYPGTGNMKRAHKYAGKAAKGAPLVIYYRQASVYQTDVAEYIESQASKLGMKPTLQASDPTNFYGALMDRKTAEGPNGYNITAYGGWCADYADGYDYINVNFDGRTIGKTGNTDYAYFNSDQFNKDMDHAASLTGSARAKAYGKLDKEFMVQYAPVIPTEISNSRTFASKRVSNWVYSTWWGQPFWNAIKLSS